jgi:hypothetical protein
MTTVSHPLYDARRAPSLSFGASSIVPDIIEVVRHSFCLEDARPA